MIIINSTPASCDAFYSHRYIYARTALIPLLGIVAENKKIPNDITYPSYAMPMYSNEYEYKYGIIPSKTVRGITLPHKRC